MMRRKQFVLSLVLALVLGGSLNATAGIVRFFVDAEMVAELPYEGLPSATPLVLAGRSGSLGVDQNSGLFDNVVVELFNGGTICADSFECYEISYWSTFGTPAPVLVGTAGASAPCLMSSGDSMHESGVYSRPLYNWSPGFRMEADVFVSTPSVDHSAGMGVCSTGVPSEERESNYSIGVTWMTTKSGEVILRLVTDLQQVDVHGPTVGSWHHIAMQTGDSVSFGETHWGVIKAVYQ